MSTAREQLKKVNTELQRAATALTRCVLKVKGGRVYNEPRAGGFRRIKFYYGTVNADKVAKRVKKLNKLLGPEYKATYGKVDGHPTVWIQDLMFAE